MKSSKLKFFLVTCMLFSLLSSCEKEGKPGYGGNPDNGISFCNTEGTLQMVSCGAGVFNGFWIRLDDGTLIMPCESEVVNIATETFTEGMRVKFGFKKIQTGSCDHLVTCLAIVPRATKARITCFKPIDNHNACTRLGTVTYHDECKLKLITNPDGKSYEPINQSALEGFNVGTKMLYSASSVQTFMASCSGEDPVVVSCARVAGFCGTDPSNCVPLTVGGNATPSAYAQIVSAKIKGNCLKLTVGFSGCTDKAQFNLSWDGSKMKSLPVQVNLVLTDVPPLPGECLAHFQKEFSFDLRSLSESPGETIIIHLNGYNEPLEYVR